MELAFKTKALQSLFLHQDQLMEKFGDAATYKIMTCLDEIRAAWSIDDIVSADVEKSDDGQSIGIRTMSGVVLCIRPNHMSLPQDLAGNLDWDEIYRLKLAEVQTDD